MHIGFLTLEYPDLRVGGIGTSIRNLARALVRQGHRATVVGWGQSLSFEDDGVKVRFWSRPSLPKTAWLSDRLLLQRELRRMVDEDGLQIVEAHDWCGPSAGIRPGCPIVIRCNGSAVFFGDLLHEHVRPSVRLAERWALRGADGIVAVSRFAAERTQRLFGLKRSIGVLFNGVELSKFEPAAAAEVDNHTLVYVGTIVRKKGVIDLCRAFSQVVTRVPNARLIVVGRDTPDKSTSSPSTWALCVRELSPAASVRVQYVGPQPNDRVQQYVRRAAACVFPSHAEALPVAWLEAMACARPIVAYDIGWASEIVQAGRTGLLAPHGDVNALAESIVKILRDPSLASSFGRAARSVAESEFSNEVTASRSINWYKSVLEAAC